MLKIFAAFAISIFGVSACAAVTCPIGSFPWIDGWGNNTCRDFGTDHDVVTEVNPATGVPNGSTPSIDSWGNRTATGAGTTEDTIYYDTSQGCPIGMLKWTDEWGNQTCKAF